MSESTAPAPSPLEQVLGIVINHWQARAVAAACELELPDLLADGPLHLDTLAERTAAEYAELYAKAGFELEQIVSTPSPHSIVIGKPRD